MFVRLRCGSKFLSLDTSIPNRSAFKVFRDARFKLTLDEKHASIFKWDAGKLYLCGPDREVICCTSSCGVVPLKLCVRWPQEVQLCVRRETTSSVTFQKNNGVLKPMMNGKILYWTVNRSCVSVQNTKNDVVINIE